VVGSGISGVALAYELVKTGFVVLSLEESQTPKYWSSFTNFREFAMNLASFLGGI